MGGIDKDSEANMKKMAEQMFNHFLHKPTVRMRQSSREKEGAGGIDALKNIFAVDTENIDTKLYKQDHHKGYRS